MANGTIALLFEGHQFRVVPQNGDALWFVLADVCEAMGLADVNRTASRLDDDEKGTHTMSTPGGPQQMLIVSEPGFYKLTETSRKPVARRLNRWYRHEVLPSIRKYGCYPPPQNAAVVPAEMAAITELFDQQLAPIRSDIKEIKTNLRVVVDNSNKGRQKPTAETQRIHAKVIRHHFYGKCPCGECDITIMDEDGLIPNVWDYHHHFNRWDNRPTATIPLAKECHQRIERDAGARTRFGSSGWLVFQRMLARMPQTQTSFNFD